MRSSVDATTTLPRSSYPDAEAMVAAMQRSVDDGDAARFAAHFADDALFRFGNGEVLHGREAVRVSTEQVGGALPWVRHEIDQVAAVDAQLFCRMTIRTARPDGVEVALPCVTVLRLDGDGLVADYRVHMDLAAAFEGPPA